MSRTCHTSSSLGRWSRILNWILILILLLPLVASVRPPTTMARVHPVLMQMAAEQPDEAVDVIVQMASLNWGAGRLVADLGGRVTKDLRLINGFAAELPARAIPVLARVAGVRAVSPDAAMVGAAAVMEPTQLTNQHNQDAGDDGSPPANPVFTTWATEFGTVSPASNRVVLDFNDELIANGSTIWFNSVVKANPPKNRQVSLHLQDAKVQFTANTLDFSLDVPDATVIYDPAARVASTVYDADQDQWITTVPSAVYGEEAFLTGLAYPVSFDMLPRIQKVTWSGRFSTDAPEVGTRWKWAAAVYSDFSTDHGALEIKPVKGNKANPYLNGDKAGTPENFKSFVVSGATGGGGTDYVGHYTSDKDVILAGFADPYAMIDSEFGPDGVYARGSKTQDAFGGFEAEITPGYKIGRVEVLLPAYVPRAFDKDIKFKPHVGGEKLGEVTVKSTIFNSVVGAASAATVDVDITASHTWRWADFQNGLELLIDQNSFDNDHFVYYDAIGLRVTLTPGADDSADDTPETAPLPKYAIDVSNIRNAFPFAVRAPEVWNEAPGFLQGNEVTIAVVDSGIGKTDDLKGRTVKNVNFNQGQHDSKDKYGHGTFVASMIAGDGKKSHGEYVGIAPKSRLLNVRVTDDEGMSYESDVVEALQWVYENKDRYNIRVVNLSLNSSVAMSYHDSPLDAAVEILWFNGIVVVVAAGNNGTAELYPPANDPFVITVGATDDVGTHDIGDDIVTSFSAYGTTIEGHSKPDLAAPGKDIVMYLPKVDKLGMGKRHRDHSVEKDLFRMSGTSMAAPVVSGAVALLLQDEPGLTPDQVKYRLMATSRTDWPGYDPERVGAGYLDVYAAVHGDTVESANDGVMPHELLAKVALIAYWSSENCALGGCGPDDVDWSSVNWSSVNWSSVNWSSVNWSSVNWSSVNWSSVNWSSVNWSSVNWSSVNWSSVNWSSVNWSSVNWSSVDWNSDYWGD